MSGQSPDWLDGPMDSAEFLRLNAHAYRDPKHAMHSKVCAEFNRMVEAEVGRGQIGPGGEVMGTPPATTHPPFLRKP